MQVLATQINARSEDFRTNMQAMRTVVADLRAKTDEAGLGCGELARTRHTARGKLLTRERVNQLVDPGSAFLEIGQLAAHGMYGGDAPAAGVIAGIGRIQGIECMVVANDATVKGGTCFSMTVKKPATTLDEVLPPIDSSTVESGTYSPGSRSSSRDTRPVRHRPCNTPSSSAGAASGSLPRSVLSVAPVLARLAIGCGNGTAHHRHTVRTAHLPIWLVHQPSVGADDGDIHETRTIVVLARVGDGVAPRVVSPQAIQR